MEILDHLIHDLALLEAVEVIMLGGSRATNQQDESSDYDLYVYLNAPLSFEERMEVLDKYCLYMEYDNHFFELEDDGILNNGVEIELIYRTLDSLEKQMEELLVFHKATLSYTTCFWDNLLASQILFDRNGLGRKLKDQYNIPYPNELKRNIIQSNFKLLFDYMPSFGYQIIKAMKRNDHISINHRTTEFLATYFNILFALNEVPHPGEKRLLQKSGELNLLPENHAFLIESLFMNMFHDQKVMLHRLRELTYNLYVLLKSEGFDVTYLSSEKVLNDE